MSTSAEFVAGLVKDIAAVGCDVWLDGGWGVDALLQTQTRPHDDVDIVLQKQDLDSVLSAFGSRFTHVERDDTRPWNFVMKDAQHQYVDFHIVSFDRQGKGIYGPPENGQTYPAEAFSGIGLVAQVPVKCMTVAFQIANRTGYPLRDKDHHDLRLLQALGKQQSV